MPTSIKTTLMFSLYFRCAVSVNLNVVNSPLVSQDFDNLSFEEQLETLDKQLVESPNSSELYALRGMVYASNDCDQEALEDFESAIQCNPEDMEAYLCKAYLLIESDETRKDAFALIESLYETHPNNPQIVVCLADLYYNVRDFDNALIYYKKATEFVISTRVFERMAMVYYSRRELECAITYVSKALLLEKDEELLYRRASFYKQIQRFEKAHEDYTEAIALADDPERFYWLRANMLLHDMHNEADAIADYEKILSLNPTSSSIHSRLGNVYYFNLRDYDNALKHYSKAIELMPDYYKNYDYYARLLNVKKRHSDALAIIEKGMALESGDYEVVCTKAITLQFLGQVSESLEYFNHAIEMNDNLFLAYLFKSQYLEELGRYDKALRNCTRGINATGGNYFLYQWRSHYYTSIEVDYSKALTDLSKAIELEPEKCWNYITRSDLYIKGFTNYDAAHDDIQKALNLEPNNPDFLARSAYVSYVTGRYDKYPLALKQITKAISLEKESGGFYHIRGGLYFEIGEYELAERDLLHCLDLVTDAVVIEKVEEMLEEIGSFYEECA